MSSGLPSPPILLDACCTINLYASRRMADILHSLPMRAQIAQRVRDEAAYVYRGGDGEDAHERDAVDLQPMIDLHLLEVIDVATDREASRFIAFASELDDGEAMTCALALHRGCSVASDDRKGGRVLAARAPAVRLYSTCELVKLWADTNEVGHRVLKQVLHDIRTRGNFFPGRHDPFQAWWHAVLST